MLVRSSAIAVAFVLSACATISDETSVPAVLEGGLNDGEKYEIRTRTLHGANGTYAQTRVVYKGFARTCILDSPNDCESKARNLIDEYDELIF
ncbi:hypothetical protein KX928_04425 [Roseobacter sp. YSTF-M11]|uniref:Lipoprotein n=1 Tax=Roseobacter insulae TaxID=2859783 RepID=A0A9X1FTB4_9RHOB|nr:hypothetical protein [Roseobacter insulae]MBW4707029.1 hypothetical protein [Roseobacter insulae]